MTAREFYAWCFMMTIAALAWLAADMPGALCFVAGAIASHADVGWIEERF